jgi:hypothetical protein
MNRVARVGRRYAHVANAHHSTPQPRSLPKPLPLLAPSNVESGSNSRGCRDLARLATTHPPLRIPVTRVGAPPVPAAASDSGSHAPTANHANRPCSSNSPPHLVRPVQDQCFIITRASAILWPQWSLMKVYSALLGVNIRRGYHLSVP